MTALPEAPVSASWRALGTYVYLTTGDPTLLEPARELAVEVLAEVDRSCSRFRDDSDLTLVNRSPGRWVSVDKVLVAATRVAVEAAQVTQGLVDPLLGRPLVGLGYSVDFGRLHEREASALPLAAASPGAWQDIELDEYAVKIPAGTALDLGATAKAWASDLVAATVVAELGGQVVVSLGGDVRIDGSPELGRPDWPVLIKEHPDSDEAGELVWLGGGGLATSSTVVRRWRSAGVERHHLLDPRSGLPVTETYRTVTATGPTCVAANAATTAAIVLGADAPAWLAAKGVTARLVAADGTITSIGSWPTRTDEGMIR